jgi:hypothetical protein
MRANKQCPRCLFTQDIAVIGEKQCNYCDLHDQLELNSKPEQLGFELDKIRKHKGQYNCLIGISGGLDSSTLLYAAVKLWGLKPLVIHFDNHWNDSIAESNMKGLIKTLGVNAITYYVDKHEYDALNSAFLRAGTPDADIPNDIAMTKLMYDTADKYGIKWILNGHDFRTEGSTPAKWTYMDAKYIKSVYECYTGKELKNYPLFTFWDQIKYALKGIKQIRPFHYGFDRESVENEMIIKTGWKSYGAKHCENIYTEYIGSKYLPEKFGIDKRRVYLSALIRSGRITKNDALIELENKPCFSMAKFGNYGLYIIADSASKVKDRKLFDHYNFKRYKAVIWVLAKLKVVPWTMFVKYCK